MKIDAAFRRQAWIKLIDTEKGKKQLNLTAVSQALIIMIYYDQHKYLFI